MPENVIAVERVNTRSNKTTNTKLSSKIKKAFTLSEVLITLSIIGVISALTIPTLYNKYQEQITISKLKKFYSTLNMAYNATINSRGPAKYWGTKPITKSNAIKVYETLFEPHFKIEKNCGIANEGDCLLNLKYTKFLGGEHYNYGESGSYKIILKDGSLTWFRGGESHVEEEFVGVYYDVNGKKEPNRLGYDLFYFQGLNDKIVPFGIDDYEVHCKKGGFQCTAWIIYKGNMKYLH